MVILTEHELQRVDPGSGKTVGELLEAYYRHGWASFRAFYEAQDWGKVRQFEEEPENLLQGHGRLRWGGADVGPAKLRLLRWIGLETSRAPLTYLEFGVREGVSMAALLASQTNRASRFHGFDTFEGLPEDWVPAWGGRPIGHSRAQGEMAAAIPQLGDRRVTFHKGLIQDTLPGFLAKFRRRGRLFVNVDTDLYSAALYVLTTMHHFMQAGDLLYLDELHDELNEFAALNDYVRSYYMRDAFRLLARAYDGYLFERCR